MPEITAVTFDLWQTLLVDNRELGLTRSNARLEGVRRILSANGEEFEPEHISEAYWDCYRQCAAIREELRDVSFPEQIGIFMESISPGLGQRLNAGGAVRDYPSLCRLIPGLPPRRPTPTRLRC